MVEDDSLQDSIARIAERLDDLEFTLREQNARLRAIEQHLNISPHPVEPRATAQSSPPEFAIESVDEITGGVRPHEAQAEIPKPKEAQSSPHQPSSSQSTPPSSGAPNPFAPPSATRAPFGAGARQARQATAPKSPTSRAWTDLEAHIGGSWFNWIGIIAITFGVAFFLKYAFENQWIGPGGRVLLGFAAGVGFLVVGERLRARGLASYAYVLSGGGIMILYLSVYAAFRLYNLIGQFPAFILMVAVTATAVLLAGRYNALPIAILGLIGGFLTPILLSTGVDNQIGLFSYIAMLDAGVLTLAYYKQWRSLNYMAFMATVLMQVGWMAAWYEPWKLWTTIFFLTFFFLIFSLLAILHNILRQRPARWLDITLIIVNATFYFGTSYALLNQENYGSWLGSFALVVSAFFVLLFYVAHSRHRQDRLLALSYLGAAITFFTMAIAIQLDQHWVTIGWAIEGAVLTWIGLRAETNAPRYAALIVFTVAVLHWFGSDMRDFAYHADAVFVPLLNRRAASCAVLVGTLAAAAWLYRRLGSGVEENERSTLIASHVLAANVLTLTLLSIDVNDYFERAKALASNTRMNTTDAARSAEWSRLEQGKQFALSALWSLYGAGALAVGIARKLKILRFAALALLAATTLKVLVLDITYRAAGWHTPIFNQTFAAFVLLVVAFAYSAWFYARAEYIDEAERNLTVPVLVVVANLLTIIALSVEANGYFEAKITGASGTGDAGQMRDLRLAQQLSLSVIWMVYGGAMLVVGIARHTRLLRIMALLLLGLTILKVFFVDLSELERFYRIISFIVLGAILLAVSYIYQKLQQRSARAESG